MALMINLAPQVEAELQREAQENGLTLTDHLQTLLTARYVAQKKNGSARRWRELRGAAAMSSEQDAQQWVSHGRDEADAARKTGLRQSE